MPEMIVKNVLGDVTEIFAGFLWDARYAWSTKYLTKNCVECQHYISQKEAIRVIPVVKASKGRCHWQPPPREKIMGICKWGVWPKILVPRPKGVRKCEYFNIPRPKKHF